MRVRPYLCWVDGSDHIGTQVFAETAGKARYRYWRDMLDVLPDLLLIQCRVRLSAEGARTSDAFRRNALYRGIPFAYCGMNVKVGGKPGVIVGHNSSANLDILFANGQVMNCHPHSEVEYFTYDWQLVNPVTGLVEQYTEKREVGR